MRRVWTTLLLGLLVVAAAPDARAFHKSRYRILLHARRDVTDIIGVSGNLIESSASGTDFSPYAYFSVDLKVASWLNLSPVAGFQFMSNEAIGAAWIHAHGGRFWAFGHFEVHPQTWLYFVQTMMEAEVYDQWITVGLDHESWGYLDDFRETSSFGAGPNVLLSMGKARFDVVMHYRDRPNLGWEPEFSIRFHYYFR